MGPSPRDVDVALPRIESSSPSKLNSSARSEARAQEYRKHDVDTCRHRIDLVVVPVTEAPAATP